jgi:hypothetical protein
VTGTLATRIRQGASLARDWIAPGDALFQFTHFVTSVCNARCAHCFYPIDAKKQERTVYEIDRLTRTMPPVRGTHIEWSARCRKPMSVPNGTIPTTPQITR